MSFSHVHRLRRETKMKNISTPVKKYSKIALLGKYAHKVMPSNQLRQIKNKHALNFIGHWTRDTVNLKGITRSSGI